MVTVVQSTNGVKLVPASFLLLLIVAGYPPSLLASNAHVLLVPVTAAEPVS